MSDHLIGQTLSEIGQNLTTSLGRSGPTLGCRAIEETMVYTLYINTFLGESGCHQRKHKEEEAEMPPGIVLR